MTDTRDGGTTAGTQGARKRRVRGVAKDNVIYYNFGKKTPTPQPAPAREDRRQTPLATTSVPNLLRSYVQSEVDSGRYNRGRDYYRDGNVNELDIQDSHIRAEVWGSQPVPFSVNVTFPVRGDDHREAIREYLRTYPSALKKAREGYLTEELAELVFKDRNERLSMSCDCPDWVPVCKHIVAVVLKAADLFAHDPRALFELRGIKLHTLEAIAGGADSEQYGDASGATGSAAVSDADSARGAGNAAESAQQWDQEEFWQGKNLPGLPHPKTAPALEESDQQLLQKAMSLTSYATVETLRAVSEIEDLYYELTHLDD